MDRRGFLGALLGGAAALTLDPDKLLWVPGKKLISVPAVRTLAPVQLAIEFEGAFGMRDAWLLDAAAAALRERIDLECEQHLVKRPTFSRLPLPRFVDQTGHLELGPGYPEARFVRAWNVGDEERDPGFVNRLDVLINL